MGKHRKEDKIVPLDPSSPLPHNITKLTSQHFERGVLQRIISGVHSKEQRHEKTSGVKLPQKAQFYIFENHQFGETNGFVLAHIEHNVGGVPIRGYIDFVMVAENERTNGIGTMLTLLMKDFLVNKHVRAIYTTILQPCTNDVDGTEGEAGYPTYGSPLQLEDWGFMELNTPRKPRFNIDGDLYEQTTFMFTTPQPVTTTHVS